VQKIFIVSIDGAKILHYNMIYEQCKKFAL